MNGPTINDADRTAALKLSHPMDPSETTYFERALWLIGQEWGKTRAEVLTWLSHEAEWAGQPLTYSENSVLPSSPGSFIQVKRVTTIRSQEEAVRVCHADPYPNSLKRCPYCGYAAKSKTGFYSGDNVGGVPKSFTYVRCTSCDARTTGYDTEARAMEQWNAGVITPPIVDEPPPQAMD